jgi:hypothetical protein
MSRRRDGSSRWTAGRVSAGMADGDAATFGSGRVEPETRPCGVLTHRADTRRGGSIKHITESARTKSETSSDAMPTVKISQARPP